MHPTISELAGLGLFLLALVHTFSTKFFEQLARAHPRHAGAWRLLGEVEVVFGIWATILMIFIAIADGPAIVSRYLDSRNFTEPMFVFVIMVIAGSKPILQVAMAGVRGIARLLPLRQGPAFYFSTLAVVPLLGSFITEPAAMTLAALILCENYFSKNLSMRLKYATIGVLFVNISIGGTLTPFAAPPVLIVANKWGWDIWAMMSMFGWKFGLTVVLNALAVTLLFRGELEKFSDTDMRAPSPTVPPATVLVHMAFLIGVIVFAHDAVIFMGLFLFFLGFATAYQQHQDPLILREGLLVAFFLAGLVVLGGQQEWWLQPLLAKMSATTVYAASTILTSIADNAAITYLGSLVENTSDEFKRALVAGAVTGGGLTIIANAPNPAGFSIVKKYFEDESINPAGLLVSALPPTIVAILVYQLLG